VLAFKNKRKWKKGNAAQPGKVFELGFRPSQVSEGTVSAPTSSRNGFDAFQEMFCMLEGPTGAEPLRSEPLSRCHGAFEVCTEKKVLADSIVDERFPLCSPLPKINKKKENTTLNRTGGGWIDNVV
jgi:hypothetical protein